MSHLELALFTPVYNEEEIVAEVVRGWRDELEGLNIAFQMLVLNDGSTDRTAEVLDTFCGDSRITIIHKPNAGFGPTVMEGYRQAVDRAPWVFHTDSDNEISPKHFGTLWEEREDYDALFGIRVNRQQPWSRHVISFGSRAAVRLRFGFGGVKDVNVPYRLLRSSVIKPIIQRIPSNTCVPNVLLSGALRRAGVRIANVPVSHEGRKTGKPSVANLKWVKFASKSLWQTLTYPV